MQKPRPALPVEIAQFHSNEYVDFLSRISPDNQEAFGDEIDRYLSEDCPVFDGLFPFCQLYAGASIEGAKKLNHGLVDIAINWGGGLHHAKKNGASGFCYVNDLVLAIVGEAFTPLAEL
jgi:histone deacetylase 1/2